MTATVYGTQNPGIHPSVQEATAAGLPSYSYSGGVITASSNGALTVDGVAVSANDRILVKNETSSNAPFNGIYVATSAGGSGAPYVLARAPDMATGAQVPGSLVLAEQGTANAGNLYQIVSAGPFTLGTTAITWTQFTGGTSVTAGTGLTESGSTIALSVPVSVADGGTGSTSQNFANLLTPTGTKTGAYTASPGDFVPCDTATVGPFTVTLPNAPAGLTTIAVKMVKQSGTNAVTIAAAGSDVFNVAAGATSLTLAMLFQGVILQYRASGNIWYVLDDDLPLSGLDSRYDAAGTSATETTRAEAAEALKAPLVSPALTGTPTAPTKTALTDSTAIATTAYTDSAVAVETSRAETAEALLAPKVSPALTGTPTAPTASALTDSTQVATTAYADSAVAAAAPSSGTPLALAKGGTGVSAASDSALLDDLGALDASENLSDLGSRQTALNNLAGAVTSGDYLRGNGTNVGMSAIQAADVPTLNQSTTGTAANITDTLDQVPVPAANVAMNSHKLTGLANGSASGDSAAFGQIPVADTTTGDIQPSPGTAAAGSNGKWADSGHIHPQPSLFAPTGLTGATAASRYAGATTSGAPGSGTFSTGDFTADQAGAIWLCTAGGSPGTWVKLGQLDGTATGIQPDGTQAAGSNGKAADSGHVHPATPSLWLPSDDGFLGANSDPGYASGGGLLSASALYLQRLNIRVATTITDLWMCVSTIGAGTSTGTFVGLLSASGSLLSGSSDVASSFTGTTGWKSLALTTPQPVTPGTVVYACVLCNLSSTQVSLLRQNNSVNAAPQQTTNVATQRWAQKTSFGTSLGAVTMSGLAPTSNTVIVAWS